MLLNLDQPPPELLSSDVAGIFLGTGGRFGTLLKSSLKVMSLRFKGIDELWDSKR